MTQRNTSLPHNKLLEWGATAEPGDETVYYGLTSPQVHRNRLFAAARKLCDTGKFAMFTKPGDVRVIVCVSPIAAAFLARF